MIQIVYQGNNLEFDSIQQLEAFRKIIDNILKDVSEKEELHQELININKQSEELLRQERTDDFARLLALTMRAAELEEKLANLH